MRKSRTINRLLAMLLTFMLAVGEMGSTGISAFAAGEETEGEGVYDDALISYGEDEMDGAAEADEDDATDEEDVIDPVDDSGEEGIEEDDMIEGDEVPDDASDPLVKNASNTLYGTSGMSNPRVPTSEEDYWQGSYVYYGKYDGEAIKYRVLDRYSNEFDQYKNTVLLDCDSILYDDAWHDIFSKRSTWEGSPIELYLNSIKFYKDSEILSDLERASIISSTKSKANNADGEHNSLYQFQPLTGEHVFLLDLREATRETYGYYGDKDSSNTRLKESKISKKWWLRTRKNASDSAALANVYEKGEIDEGAQITVYGVSPAFNVNLASVLFSTAIYGTKGELGTDYKLTLLDINADTEDVLDDGL
nr:DUF6273 domain-containing protein [Lachnospiraceae bacterium]